MLEPLAALLKRAGWLSELIINGCKDVPSSWRYRRRFGSLARAYELIGFNPERDFRYIESNRFLHSLHAGIVAEAVAAIERSGSTVLRDSATDLLTINGEFTASILLVGCTERDGHLPRWTIRFASRLRPDITIAVRMGAGNREVLDYYILPRLDFAATDFFVSETNALHIDAYRFTTLQPFLDLTMRTNVGRST